MELCFLEVQNLLMQRYMAKVIRIGVGIRMTEKVQEVMFSCMEMHQLHGVLRSKA